MSTGADGGLEAAGRKPFLLTGRKTVGLLRFVSFLVAVAAVWSFQPVPAGAQNCAGDCNGDEEVAINELITCVNIALAELPMDTCLAADADGGGEVEINDLIAAVNAALSGCAAPGTGSIRVELTGNLPATESVKIAVDGGVERLLFPGENLLFTGLEPGMHEVRVGELPENCQVSGGNVWPANVIGGQTSEVFLDVICSEAPGGDHPLWGVLYDAGTYQEGEPFYSESPPSDPFEEETEDGSIWICTTQTVSAEQYPHNYATFDPNAEVIYPGSMLQGETLEDATPEPIVVDRAGGTFVINLLNASSGTYQSVEEVKQSTVVQAINDILAENTGVVPARFNYQSSETQSMEQLALSLGVNVSTLTFDFQSRLRFSTEKNYNRFVVEMTQSFYTVSFDLPTSLDELFAPDVTVDDLEPYVGAGNPATYISSVTYGRRFYLLIESTASTTEMAAAIKASYDTAVVNGEIEAGVTYVKDLSNVNVKVFALGGDQSLATAMFTGDPQALGEFLTEGADIRTGVPLSYVVRNVLDNKVVNVKVATDYDVKTCSPSGEAFYSDFDVDAEGWTSYSNGIGQPTYKPAELCQNDRGGCISMQDGEADSANPDGQFRAPAAWRDQADWSHFYGGSLSYSMRILCLSGCAGGLIPWGNDVTIESQTDAIYLDLPPELIQDMYLRGWEDVRISLEESGTTFRQGVARRWQVERYGERCDATKEEIIAVLSNVSDFRIRADYVSGTEETWLDEVGLLPPPVAGDGCEDSGGTVGTSMCCEGVGDFPDTCSVGNCGCAPEFSHEVVSCDCGAGRCFDGARCVVPIAPECEEPDVLVRSSSETVLYAEFDWTATDEWITSALNLDAGSKNQTGWHTYAYMFGLPYEMTHWCTAASSNMWRLNFTTDYWNLKNVPFENISAKVIESTLAVNKHQGGNAQYANGDVFVLMTDQGNLAKVKVLRTYDKSRGWPYEWRYRNLYLQYEVYSRPETSQ